MLFLLEEIVRQELEAKIYMSLGLSLVAILVSLVSVSIICYILITKVNR